MTNNDIKIKEVEKFWDNIAGEYDRINRKIGRAHFQRFKESLKYLDLKTDDKVLNIWSRTGNGISYIKETENINLYNLEVSGKMIRIAKEKYPEEYFAKTDLTNLDYQKNFFDKIISLETLEHCPDPQKFLNELYRVIKPGGVLVMSLPPSIAEIPLKIYETFFENHGEGPHKFISPKKVKIMIKNSGFDLVLHKGTLLIPVGPERIQMLGEKIIDKLQKTPVKNLGIRQFYVCKKNL